MQETNKWSKVWTLIALVWALLLCFVPDPRPLATPAWSIDLVRKALHVQEAAARVIAALGLRMLFLGLLGLVVMAAANTRRVDRRGMIALVMAPVLGIVTLSINHGHFPIGAQMKLSGVASLAGALALLLVRRNWLAGAGLLGVLGFTFVTLTNYDVSDDLDGATRVQVKHILALAEALPEGDARCLGTTSAAFALARERSRNSDPVLENQAAVLALALVLGDEKLAKVADRYVDPATVPLCERIREGTTLHERPDWSRHFWVSAGLVVLSGESRSLNVGLIKEMKDANAGGSGFSFGDLTADAAGDRFALVATRDVASAVAMQERLMTAVRAADLMPDAHDLPEGIRADAFEAAYGGVGGARTDSLVQLIRARLKDCALLH